MDDGDGLRGVDVVIHRFVEVRMPVVRIDIKTVTDHFRSSGQEAFDSLEALTGVRDHRIGELQHRAIVRARQVIAKLDGAHPLNDL